MKKNGNAVVVDTQGCSWAEGSGCRSCEVMDTNTAQVTPAEVTQRMVDVAQSNGATLVISEVTGLCLRSPGGTTKCHVWLWQCQRVL